MRSRTPNLDTTEPSLNERADCPLRRANRPGAIDSSRTRGLLIAGLVAVTATPAAIAPAAEPDTERDGSAAAQAGAADLAVSPNYDPGGNPTQLPDTAPASEADRPPQPGGGDHGAPVDRPATTDLGDPVVDNGDGEASSERDASGQTPNAAPGSATPGASSPAAAPAINAGGAPPLVIDPPAPAAAPTIPTTVPRAVVGARHTLTVRQRPATQRARRSDARTIVVASSGASGGDSLTAPRAAASSPPSPPRDPGGRVRRGERTHIVLEGESLWAIASDLLGSGATDAQIARQVQLLWKLNHTRIATGDPELLYAGTKLVLRYPTSNTPSTR